MKIPSNLSEGEVLTVMEEVMDAVLKQRHLIFGIHTEEDIRQEGILHAIAAMEDFNYEKSNKKQTPHKALFAFLLTHVNRRLENFRRDNFSRSDSPCKACPFWTKIGDVCNGFVDRSECEPFSRWMKRNLDKQSIASPDYIDQPGDLQHNASCVVDTASYNELVDNIEQKLPQSLRSDFHRLIAGEKISPYQKDKIQLAVRTIINAER